MDPNSLISDYEAGTERLRKAVAGLGPQDLDARPIPGKWSIREVVAHLADFEPVYCNRMKRVIAEEEATLLSGDPDLFAAKLAYGGRDIDEELALIEAVRKHTVRILRTLDPADFQRTGRHTTDGPLSLETLLKRITGHVPHHIAFIDEKRRALGL